MTVTWGFLREGRES